MALAAGVCLVSPGAQSFDLDVNFRRAVVGDENVIERDIVFRFDFPSPFYVKVDNEACDVGV